MFSASSVPGSCDASKTRAPASTRATAAVRPTGCSAPITSARLPLSEKSLSPSGSGIVRSLPLNSHFVKHEVAPALQQAVEKGLDLAASITCGFNTLRKAGCLPLALPLGGD